MGSSTLSFLLTCQSPESCLSRQVSRWPQTSPPQQEAKVCRPGCDSRRSTTVCKTTPSAPSSRLGGLRQACFRRPHAGVALSWSLHPSRSDFQSSIVSLRPRTRDFPLEGLRPRQQARQDDSGRDRVFTSLLSARAAQRLCPHPALRLSCQSFSGFSFGLGSTAPGFE